MSDMLILRGSHLLTDPRLKARGLIEGGAIAIRDGLVAEVGPFAALAAKHPGAKVLGDGTQLLLPGLVDAHSHGRGMSPIQKGVFNDFLENCLLDWAYMPLLPPELTAGTDSTQSPVLKIHFGSPVALSKAYRLWSFEPTYTVPSGPTTGEDEITSPALTAHF